MAKATVQDRGESHGFHANHHLHTGPREDRGVSAAQGPQGVSRSASLAPPWTVPRATCEGLLGFTFFSCFLLPKARLELASTGLLAHIRWGEGREIVIPSINCLVLKLHAKTFQTSKSNG